MADSKISQLTELTTVANDDLLPVVDVSDTSDSPSGTTKRIKKSNLVTIPTHTGEVTGDTVLTLNKTAITNKPAVTPADGDVLIISDVSDNGNLKQITVGDLPGGAVESVNGLIGEVELNQDDIPDGVANKSYTATEKTKLAGVETGAEVNNISDANATDLTDAGDSALHFHNADRNRANHTGSQAISTVTNLQDNLDAKQNTLGFTPENIANKGAVNGYAELDGTGKVPSAQLPSYVDDVLEYANLAAFPVTGEANKIYIAIDTNITYRWSGSVYVSLASDIALGETSSTAYRGDRGKIAYDHSQSTGNPHGTTATQVPFTPTGSIAATDTQSAITELDTETQTALGNKVDKNTSISGATKTKVTYDSKGLVTAGTDATTADIADSTDKRYVTDAEKTTIGDTSGVNTGDQTLNGLLPTQTGNAGKFLNTDGTNSSWQDIPGGGDMLGSNNLSDVANAATSRTNLGLGNVENYGTASQAEAEAGTATNKNMTPERVSQAIAALAPGGMPKLRYQLNGQTNQLSTTSPVNGSVVGFISGTTTGQTNSYNQSQGYYQVSGTTGSGASLSQFRLGVSMESSASAFQTNGWDHNPVAAAYLMMAKTSSANSNWSQFLLFGAGNYSSSDKFVGFRVTGIAGVTTIYAVHGNGTTMTATDITSYFTSWANMTPLHVSIDVRSGVDIKFYVGSTLVATHTTDLPSGQLSTTAIVMRAETTAGHNSADSANMCVSYATLEYNLR